MQRGCGRPHGRGLLDIQRNGYSRYRPGGSLSGSVDRRAHRRVKILSTLFTRLGLLEGLQLEFYRVDMFAHESQTAGEQPS